MSKWHFSQSAYINITVDQWFSRCGRSEIWPLGRTEGFGTFNLPRLWKKTNLLVFPQLIYSAGLVFWLCQLSGPRRVAIAKQFLWSFVLGTSVGWWMEWKILKSNNISKGHLSKHWYNSDHAASRRWQCDNLKSYWYKPDWSSWDRQQNILFKYELNMSSETTGNGRVQQ